jgi:hypothetical protein
VIGWSGERARASASPESGPSVDRGQSLGRTRTYAATPRLQKTLVVGFTDSSEMTFA